MGLHFKIKKSLKNLLMKLESILPRTWFDNLYKTLFASYKASARTLYLLKAFVYLVTGQREQWQMAITIWRVIPYTLVGIGGLEATYKVCMNMVKNNIPGDFVELGVARGGCAALIATVMLREGNKRNLWLFDSYEGLPDPTNEDYQNGKTGDHLSPLVKGSCLGTLEQVKWLLFEKFKIPTDSIKFVKGWFQDTIPVEGQKIQEIAVLRIDGDWYESTKVCLDGLYAKVVSGGAVVIDDYHTCYGCEKAVNEFIHENKLKVEINLDGRGGCYFYNS